MHFSPLQYLDPGSGSLVIQIAIAALLGLAVFFRSSWGKIRGMFGAKPKEDDDQEDDAKQ